MNLSGCSGHVKSRCARHQNPVHNYPVLVPIMAAAQLRRKMNMLSNFFSSARKYLYGAVSALAAHLPLIHDRGVLSSNAIALASRPLGVGERKAGDSGRFWWRRESWVTPAFRHQVQNSKPIQAAENRLLQALVKRNAYYHGA